MPKLDHLLLASSLSAATLLAGCAGLSPAVDRSVPPVSAAAPAGLHGSVQGGQQPVAGANVQLFAVNTSTLRGASTLLLSVPTDAKGNFDTGTITCPAPTSQMYLTARGGNPGAGTNPAVGLMTGLGSCSTLASRSGVQINEVTTVASAYALQGFMLDYNHVGSPAATAAGLANAFSMINGLVNTTTGSLPGTTFPVFATSPVTTIYSLADILAGCVNSTGTGSPCTTLFSAATSTTRGTPTDTLTAILAIASQPATSVSTLFSLLLPAAPFQPVLASAPNDWSIAVVLGPYNINMQSVHSIAIDANGSAWTTSESGNTVNKIGPLGDPAYTTLQLTSGGLSGPQGIAIDPSGDAWIANTGASTIVEYTNLGVLASGAGFTAGSINTPVDLAIDKSGNVWVANFAGNSVTELNGLGANVGSSPYTNNGVSAPTGIAVAPSGDIWVASGGSGQIFALSPTGVVRTGAGFTDGWLQGTGTLAISPAGDAWVADPGIDAVSGFGPTYVALSAGSPTYSSGLATPLAVALDGNANVWVASSADGSGITELTAHTGAAIAGTTGLGTLDTTYGIAVDGSGNVWTANQGSNTLTIFVGVATPAITPLVARLP